MQYTGAKAGMAAAVALAMTAGLLVPNAGPAQAKADDTAFVITGSDLRVDESTSRLRVHPQPGFTQIGRPNRSAVGLIYNPVLVPEATVREDVSRTPALPHLITMKMGETTILIDPHANYQGERPGGLDEGHSIIRAQRAWRALQAKGTRVIHRPVRPNAADTGTDAASADHIRPSAILLRPDFLDRPGVAPIPDPTVPQSQPMRDRYDGMPSIPRPQKMQHQKMAAAD